MRGQRVQGWQVMLESTHREPKRKAEGSWSERGQRKGSQQWKEASGRANGSAPLSSPNSNAQTSDVSQQMALQIPLDKISCVTFLSSTVCLIIH